MYYNIIESGKRIKEIRERKGLKQEETSVALGISLDGYRKIERGCNGAKIDTLVCLADYFNTSLDYLVGGIEAKSEIDIMLESRSEGEKQYILAMVRDMIKNLDLIKE